jgi:sec-independent protein translocase protein TatA
MGGLQPWHLIIVVFVGIMLFGSKRLPDSARAVGKSLRIFKAEMRAMGEDEPTGQTRSEPAPPAAPQALPASAPQVAPQPAPPRQLPGLPR